MNRARAVRVDVALGDRAYPVLVGGGAARELAGLLPPTASRVAVVTQAGIPAVEFEAPDVEVFEIADGESAKSLATVEALCRSFSRLGLTRHDVVIGLGGGVVTDVAGFAAACYHRGVSVIHVPSTLVGQVDAAIGGKCGVNLPEGKNLVGAFHQPLGVICDVDLLGTLPEAEWACGRGEVAKYALIGAGDLAGLALAEQVAACVRFKAEVVAADERELTGRRMVLNYGHTLAHGLEATAFGRPGAEIRHGQAVAVGIAFAARLARRTGRIGDGAVERHDAVLAAFGLSGDLPAWADAGELLTLIARDKKATDGLTFVLDGPRGVEPVAGVDPEVVRAVLGEMGAGAGR